MDNRYLAILIVMITISTASAVAFASEQNNVGVMVGPIRMLDVESSSFEAGKYTLQRRFTIGVWNWPDRSGENIEELRIILEPKQPSLFKNIEIDGGEVVSKDPYTLLGRDIPMGSGMEIKLETDATEDVKVPISIERDVDISYFETTGTQLVTITAKPESDIEEVYVNFQLSGDRYDYQDLVDVELLSTSQDYFQEMEGDEIRFSVPQAKKGEEYVFKVELQITPKKERVTYVPNVFVAIGGGQREGESIVGNSLERSTNIGALRILSAEEVNFRIESSAGLGVYMQGVTTTTRFLEERPTTTPPAITTGAQATVAPTSAPGRAQPFIPAVTSKDEKDSDGDGWSDEQEKRAGTNPFAKDTDGDGIWDSKDPNPLEPAKVSEEKKRDVDWEQIGVILAITGATIGGILSRRKRGRVKKLLDDIDKTYESFKMNSRRCEAELYRHRGVVSDQLKKGKINEESYSILDKRIDDYLSEIRERIMDEKVGKVPAHLKDEVHRMLEDGEISENEYEAFENILGKSKGIGKKEKSDLKDLFKKWRDEDKITGVVLDKYIDEYMKDIGKIEEKVSGVELKSEIDKIMEDGIVTSEEYEEFSEMLDRSDLSEDEKEGLKKKLGKIRDLTNRGS